MALTLPQWRVIEVVMRAQAAGVKAYLTPRDAKVFARALVKVESEVRQRQHRLDQNRWHRSVRCTDG